MRPSSGLACSAATAASNTAENRASASGSRLTGCGTCLRGPSTASPSAASAASRGGAGRRRGRGAGRGRGPCGRTCPLTVVAASDHQTGARAANSTRSSHQDGWLPGRSRRCDRRTDVPSANAACTSGIAAHTAARSAITRLRGTTAAPPADASSADSSPPSPRRPRRASTATGATAAVSDRQRSRVARRRVGRGDLPHDLDDISGQHEVMLAHICSLVNKMILGANRLPQRRHRRVAAGDGRDTATAAGAGAADEEVGVGGLDAPAADVLGAFGERPLQRRDGRCCRPACRGGPRSRAGPSPRCTPGSSRQSSIGSSSTLSSDRMIERVAAASAPAGSARNRRVGMCSANSVSVWAPAAVEVGTEDRGVGQRVAVDLARDDVGDRPGGGLLVGASELAVALVDVERAGERPRRRDAAVAQPRQSRQQHVDLHLRALHGRRRRGRSQAAERARPGRRWRTPGGRGSPAGGERDRRAPVVHPDRGDLGPGAQLGAPTATPPRRAAPTTVPIPPTGTSQRPVPPPITWYRKQRLAARSWASANVPIRASVSTIPRTVSSRSRRSISSPIGRSTSASTRRRRRRGAASRRDRAAARSASGRPARRPAGHRVQRRPRRGVGAEGRGAWPPDRRRRPARHPRRAACTTRPPAAAG